MTAAAPLRLLRLSDVLGRVAIKRSAWYAMVAAGQAPQPVHCGRCAAWPENEINAWVVARVSERPAREARS